MSEKHPNEVNAGFARQALKRPVSPAETRLAECLEQVFRSGVKDFSQVALLLQQNGVQPPSGAAGPWTVALLEQELKAINASFDHAYDSRNIG